MVYYLVEENGRAVKVITLCNACAERRGWLKPIGTVVDKMNSVTVKRIKSTRAYKLGARRECFDCRRRRRLRDW